MHLVTTHLQIIDYTRRESNLPHKTAGKQHFQGGNDAHSDARRAPNPHPCMAGDDPDLARLAELWPSLPAATRGAILQLVDDAPGD